MSWLLLTVSCFLVSFMIHGAIRHLWIAIPLAAVLGPAAFFAASAVADGALDAFAAIGIIFSQVVSLPVSVFVGALFKECRGWRRPNSSFKSKPLRGST